jgi:hypothetical protein
MKIKHLSLALVGLALFSVLASPTFACRCRKPGRSPGWWKHQFNAYLEDKGKPHVSWSRLETWTESINATWDDGPPSFYGYPLPPVTSLDYNNDGSFTTDDAYGIFNDIDWNHLWTQLANWYNWASGRRPYWG